MFWTVILFNCLNINMFFLLVCLSDCKYLLFPCVSDTLAGDFLSEQLLYWGKLELCHPLYDFRGKKIEIIFRECCRPRKIKSAKINPHVFETKPRKFGDAKISHFTVSQRCGSLWSFKCNCAVTKWARDVALCDPSNATVQSLNKPEMWLFVILQMPLWSH